MPRLTLTDNILIGLVVTSLATAVPAYGHSWYPRECCHDEDCAPVLKIQQVPEGRLMTTKHGTVLVPTDYKMKPSEDSDYHVCMTKDGEPMSSHLGEMILICAFEPMGS